MEHTELSWCGLLGDLVCEGKSDSYGTDERGRRVNEAHSALFNKLRAMDHERTALQRDAERYRWLRNGLLGDFDEFRKAIESAFDPEATTMEPSEFDAAIDAAMKG